MLMSEIKDDSMTDHVEILIETSSLRLVEAIFEERTAPTPQVLDIREGLRLVNIYKAERKRAVIVNFITTGQLFYPAQLADDISHQQHIRKPFGGTAVVPVLHPKLLLYQRLMSFHFMPETDTEDSVAKREMVTQIEACLAMAARSAQTSPQVVGQFRAEQAMVLRGQILDLIDFQKRQNRNVTEDQIDQWRALGVGIAYDVIPKDVGNIDPRETFHTAFDGL